MSSIDRQYSFDGISMFIIQLNNLALQRSAHGPRHLPFQEKESVVDTKSTATPNDSCNLMHPMINFLFHKPEAH
jgi:hypothetical protein